MFKNKRSCCYYYCYHIVFIIIIILYTVSFLEIWRKLFIGWALAEIIKIHTERTKSVLQSVCYTLCENCTRTYGNRSLAAFNLSYMVSRWYTFHCCTLQSREVWKRQLIKKMNGCSCQQVLRQSFNWFLSQHRKTFCHKGFILK